MVLEVTGMYADVLIQYGTKELDRTFTYRIPENLRDIIDVGMKVYVPFASNKINGFVLKIHEHMDEVDYEIKDIIDVINKDFKLNKELLELGHYIKEKTLCTLISAYQTMLPSSLKVNNSKESYSLIIKYLSLACNPDELDSKELQLTKRQKEIIDILKKGRVLKKDIKSPGPIKKLLELNLIKEESEMVYRLHNEEKKESGYTLTEDQTRVYEEIKEEYHHDKTILLHGVTGSGKTEVYMRLCEDMIKENKSVIMLVPEISLTTQIVRRFYNRFGDDVAIFHSSLSDGEKYDEYKKIMNKEIHIVVGTRSAIFTPVKDLDLIIIDEEHSSTYKQENNPRYHALDMATFRSKYHKCPILLGSATPSLESMARALKGVYKYVELKKRIGTSTMPHIEIIDMVPEFKKRNMILSDTLKEKIMQTLERKEQVMLLLNRRGFSTIVTCQCCGFTYKCPHCDISLTYHKTSNSLRCHYCGYTVIRSDTCPEGGEEGIRSYGLGTEKVEELLHELYPSYRIQRMDADTTSRKGEHERIIKDIEDEKIDIIIGTQMISKGLDFPKVTLVGIINADESLNIPDFRSGENTFNLLSQVSGRAGRSKYPGEVIIQTFNPDNKTLLYVAKNDYMSNYLYEMNIRKLLKYPPYYYLVSIKVTSKNYELASKESVKVANYLRNHIDISSICLGPTTAAMFRINNIYRFQIIIKYRHDDKLMNCLKDIDQEFLSKKNVNIEIDIDPLRI